MNPLVSIVIPCYNYRTFISHAVDTCLSQDYSGEVEVIVIDDCSEDDSFYKVTQEFGNRIKLLRNKYNRGYSFSKNVGIEASSGQYIATLDADDMLTKDSIRVRVDYLESHQDKMMVHAQAYTIKGEGCYDYWFRRLYKIKVSSRTDKIHAQTVMFRRYFFCKYGLFDERLRSRSDNEMWHRVTDACNDGDKIGYVPYPVAFYRRHDNSMIQYRKNNPDYNITVSSMLELAKKERLDNGVTKDNTRFLGC